MAPDNPLSDQEMTLVRNALDAVELTDQMLASAENATVSFAEIYAYATIQRLNRAHGCCRPCRKTVVCVGISMRYFATPRSIFCHKSRRRAAVTFRRAKSTGVRSHSARRVPMRIRYSLLSNWSIMTRGPARCLSARRVDRLKRSHYQHRDPAAYNSSSRPIANLTRIAEHRHRGIFTVTEEACVAVLIATTNGPVEVQRITEEDPDIDSVVCLAGKAKPLPISGAYHDFVRQPSGVLQRDFGHAAYRVDLSATIEDGYSWQFGLYLAHALHAAGRLASTIDDATHIMFATGEVNIDLDVLGIGHVSAKLESLREQASEYCIQHKTVGFFLPEANADDLEATVRLDEFEIVRCSHVRDALGSLPFELAPISRESAPPPTPLPSCPRNHLQVRHAAARL